MFCFQAPDSILLVFIQYTFTKFMLTHTLNRGLEILDAMFDWISYVSAIYNQRYSDMSQDSLETL